MVQTDEFAADYANDTYSYSTDREDLAMVFEAVMMKMNYNADRDMAIVNQYDVFDCDTVLVKWGQRGRMGEPAILDRSRTIMAMMIPEMDATDFLNNQPLPTQIPYDASYCALNYSQAVVQKPQIQLSEAEKVSAERQWANQREIE